MRRFLTGAVVGSVALCAFSLDAREILISECVAINEGSLTDEEGDEPDWIELHNSGISTVDLTGWHLTDDADDLRKWAFPSVSIGPDDYLVVFASNKNRIDPAGELHTNFKLSGGGEYLALVRPDLSVEHEYAPDTDEDGMTDWWEKDNNLIVGIDDAGLDPDQDGMTNAEEETAGTDPHDTDDVLRAIAMKSGVSVRLGFEAMPDLGYTVQHTDSLAPLDWQSWLQIGAEPTNQSITIVVPSPGPDHRCFRVVTPAVP